MTTSSTTDWATDVASALSRLNRRRAAFIEAVYFRGLTQAEVAARSGETPAEVAREIATGMREIYTEVAAGQASP